MKAVGYIRVSTEGQAKDGVSLDNQRKRIKTYCQYKDFELVEIIEDAGISGGINKARGGFINLLDRTEQRGLDVIILYSLERLSRDMLTLLALERLLDEYDVELHTIEGQIDTSTPDGFMSFAMRAFLGEMERRQVKYRTKKAMEHKKANGEVVGTIPFGCRREGKELIPDLNEQAIIDIVNELYERDTRLVDIVRSLNDQGKRTRTGKPWTPTQVKRLITDYQSCFRKSNTRISIATRKFIETIA
ncbi:MAG: recombinase family protein [Deltaproteobacteria bacterium]|jgi:site-specific DNA recombinase|nr:recombinase family protein [Deltaproteobacteria bacterium]